MYGQDWNGFVVVSSIVAVWLWFSDLRSRIQKKDPGLFVHSETENIILVVTHVPINLEPRWPFENTTVENEFILIVIFFLQIQNL